MSEKNSLYFTKIVTAFSLIVSIIGSYLLIYENNQGASLGITLFFFILGIGNLFVLFHSKLIKNLDWFAVSLIISYFLLTFSFQLNTKDHTLNVLLLIPLLTFINITLTTKALREHFIIRSIMGGIYYIGGKFLGLFNYIGDISKLIAGKSIHKSNNIPDIIKTVLIFLVIGMPLILIIVGLLSASSDEFSKAMSSIFSFDFDLGLNFGRAVFVLFVSAYLITDLYFLKALNNYEPALEKDIKFDISNTKNILRAGILTTTIINIFYIFFIFVDFSKELANARQLLLDKGVNTYSEFAVGRFWELIIVSIINLVIFYAFTGFYKQLHSGNSKILKPYITTSLVILFMNSLGLIFSVHQRLSLYENGYGFTDKRFLAHLFIILLSVIFVLSLIGIFSKNHSKLQLISLSFLILFFASYFAAPTDYLINKINYELTKQNKIVVYDPNYSTRPFYCDEDYFIYGWEDSGYEGLFVAKEILNENKINLKPSQQKCLEQSLKNFKERDFSDNWRDFSMTTYILQNYTK